MRNVAAISRREFDEARWIINGVTASVPAYAEADSAGNKEWLVDVAIGPTGEVIKGVPIVPAAKQLITDLRQPVQVEKSKQGKYTVIGRAKVMTAGVQTPDGSVMEPTFREIEVNLAQINALHIADLDYQATMLQDNPDRELQPTEDTPLQDITATDAFGHPVGGDDDTCTDASVASLTPVKHGKTKHVIIDVATLGPPGDPYAMDWGVSELQPAVYKIIEVED